MMPRKYKVTKLYGDPIPEDEPAFVLRARDFYALAALYAYLDRCHEQYPEFRTQIENICDEFYEWRSANADKLKYPSPAQGVVITEEVPNG